MRRLLRPVVFCFAIGLLFLIPQSIQANSYGETNNVNYSGHTQPPICTQDVPYSPNISWESRETPASVLGTSTQIQPEPTPTTPTTPDPSPTLEPTQAPSPTPLPPTPEPEEPETQPEPTQPEAEPVNEPTTQAAANEGGHDTNKILDLINQHRAGKGLPAYPRDDRLCQIAQARIPQLQGEMFGDNYIHQGFDAMDHDYWITENMVYQPTEEAALGWWLRSGLHRAAVESIKHTHSCGACSGKVCIQLFSSFIPK